MGMKDLSTYREEKAPLSSIQWLNQQKCNEHLLCFRHRGTIGKMSHNSWLHGVFGLMGESAISHRTPRQIWNLSRPTSTSFSLQAKYHLCSAGWLDSGRVAYPTSYASQNCGSGVVGIVDYGPRNNKSEMWDVFCYRMKGNGPNLASDSRPCSC